jgi:hypothetical protein
LAEALVLATIVAGAGFGLYMIGSVAFNCGRFDAGMEVRYWMAASLVQGLLFMLGSVYERARRAYRILQLVTVPLLALVVSQLAFAYPRIVVCIMLFTAFYAAVAALPAALGRRSTQPWSLSAFVAQATVFLLLTLIVHSALAFVPLHWPGKRLDDTTYWTLLSVSALASAVLVRREAARIGAVSLTQMPPLALLVVALLRAKYPDGAFDTLFYKATIPFLLADWRTAFTGAFDHTLLGSNLMEIMSAQLRVIDPTWSPPLISSLAFGAMWVVAPLAASAVFARSDERVRAFAIPAATLMMASLTEALMAAGTAYHEPLMMVLMAAFLLPTPLAWIFLAAAMAAKLTVLFIAPVLIALRLRSWADAPAPADGAAAPGSGWRPTVAAAGAWRATVTAAGAWRRAAVAHLRSRPVLLAACLVFGAFVVGEQLQRNLAFSSRILGSSDLFVEFTDPDRRTMTDVITPFAPWHLGERLAKTYVHILTLDRWIPAPAEGFHILPASRVIAVCVTLALLFAVFPSLRRADGRSWTLLLLFVACSFATLLVVSQGRHLATLSFGAALLVAHAAAYLAVGALRSGRRVTASAFAVAVALLATGDQLVGNFINNGWDCRRSIAGPVTVGLHDQPNSELEKRLAEIVTQYRAKAKGGVPPSVLCHWQTERKAYIGTHHVFAHYSVEYTQRFVNADPERAAMLPTSILALCFKHPSFGGEVLPVDQRGQFYEVPPTSDGVRIFVSQPLMSGVPVTSIPATVVASGPRLFTFERGLRGDLMARWDRARLLDLAAADAPGGKGAFAGKVGSDPVGVLISPYRIAYEGVEVKAGDQLTIEAAMPYSNSDGMSLAVTFEARNGKRHSASMALTAKPQAAAGPVWRSQRITVPPEVEGRGRIVIAATSPSGDGTADWAYIRKISLDRQ